MLGTDAQLFRKLMFWRILGFFFLVPVSLVFIFSPWFILYSIPKIQGLPEWIRLILLLPVILLMIFNYYVVGFFLGTLDKTKLSTTEEEIGWRYRERMRKCESKRRQKFTILRNRIRAGEITCPDCKVGVLSISPEIVTYEVETWTPCYTHEYHSGPMETVQVPTEFVRCSRCDFKREFLVTSTMLSYDQRLERLLNKL
jgi:hypothetical protein